MSTPFSIQFRTGIPRLGYFRSTQGHTRLSPAEQGQWLDRSAIPQLYRPDRAKTPPKKGATHRLLALIKQPQSATARDRAGPAMHVELAIDILEMPAHRPDADHQLLGDSLI